MSVSPSVEPIVSIRSAPTTSVVGVSFAPVLANSIAGASEPFLVTPKLLKSLCREELRGVSSGMTERFQQARRDEDGNLVRFEAEEPSRLQRVETGGNYLPTQKFSLLRKCVHTRPFFHGSIAAGVSNTPNDQNAVDGKSHRLNHILHPNITQLKHRSETMSKKAGC